MVVVVVGLSRLDFHRFFSTPTHAKIAPIIACIFNRRAMSKKRSAGILPSRHLVANGQPFVSLSLSLFFHTFYELIEPPRTRILSDASSLNSLIKYAGIIYSSLRFASFFSPFILFPLFDTFSLPLPSLAFLTQLGIGDAPPLPRAFIWNFNSQLITRRLFHRHRQDLDLIRIKQHFYPLFFLASLFLFIFIHFFPTEKWSELHFLRLTATSVEWERTTAGRERRKKRKSRVPARG